MWRLGDWDFMELDDAERKTLQHVKVEKDGIWELLPQNHFVVQFQTVFLSPGWRNLLLIEVS